MGRHVCDAPASSLSPNDPSCQQTKRCGSGDWYLPTYLWPVPFGIQGVQRGCPQNALPSVPSSPTPLLLAPSQVRRLRRWSLLARASGGVAHAAQPISLAHAHNSTRPRDLVRQATSQGQRRSRDFGWQSRTPLSCARRLLSS